MIEVVCPKCGSVLTSHVITTYPPINKVSCPHCGWEREDKQNIIRVVVQEPPIQTHADHIRAMSDEELADYLWSVKKYDRSYDKHISSWLRWLRSPEVDNG